MMRTIFFRRNLSVKNWIWFPLFLITVFSLSSGNIDAQDALWMRYPAISPDGQHIVFSYQGNLYRVNSSGGRALLQL